MAHNLGTHFGCMEPRNVCWAHGVNNSEALDVALADKSCHMIEADLMIRGASTRSSKAAARWKAAGSSTRALTAPEGAGHGRVRFHARVVRPQRDQEVVPESLVLGQSQHARSTAGLLTPVGATVPRRRPR